MYGDGNAPGEGHRAGDAVPAGTPGGGSVRRALQARIAVVAFSLVASLFFALVLSTVLGPAG